MNHGDAVRFLAERKFSQHEELHPHHVVATTIMGTPSKIFQNGRTWSFISNLILIYSVTNYSLSLSLSIYIYETQKLTIIKVKLFSQLDGNNFFLKIIKDKPIKYI